MANGNGGVYTNGRLTYRQLLQWVVPVLLGAMVTGMIAIWSKLDSIQGDLRAIDSRVVAVENSRFTTADGLNMWRGIDGKVSQDDFNAAIRRIEDILDEIRQP